ncbi:MAG: SGNH/GDSL hydrolase family protein [Chloroflexi bacterium]|nr:SGNH/GDSL hydrolase family protein [Chloroflexota bacterium]
MRSRTQAWSACAACLLLSLIAGPAAAAPLRQFAWCAPGVTPAFAFGFAALRVHVGAAMGEPIECEHANPENGDTLQQTTTGLAFYRKRTNTPTFTDGQSHWALTTGGLETWQGSAVDPPSQTAPVLLVLGDSLALGEGATDPAQLGYVPLTFAALRPLGFQQVTSLAQRAETVSTFLATGGQFEQALALLRGPDSPPRALTLQVGGNDLLHLLNGPPCLVSPSSAACTEAVRAALKGVAAGYPSVLASLRNAAGAARIVVLTYYNPFSGTGTAYDAFTQRALRGTALEPCSTADPVARGLNGIIRCAAQAAGVEVLDIEPLFRGRGLAFTHVAALDAHPTDAGYAVIADALIEALRQGS